MTPRHISADTLARLDEQRLIIRELLDLCTRREEILASHTRQLREPPTVGADAVAPKDGRGSGGALALRELARAGGLGRLRQLSLQGAAWLPKAQIDGLLRALEQAACPLEALNLGAPPSRPPKPTAHHACRSARRADDCRTRTTAMEARASITLLRLLL